MQLAQLYVGAVVAGGVVGVGSLLLGGFGQRDREGFTPTSWAVVSSSALVLGGVVGLLAVVWWPSPAQRGSLAPALAAAGLAGLLGGLVQRRAARRAVPPPDTDATPPPEGREVAPGAGEP